MFDDFQGEDDVEGLALGGEAFGGRRAVGDLQPHGRGVGPGDGDILVRRVDAGHPGAQPCHGLGDKPAAGADIEQR